MQRSIICMILLVSQTVVAAFNAPTTLIQPVPFEQQTHGTAEFACGLVMGTAITCALLNPAIALQYAETIFSGCLAHSFLAKQLLKKPYKRFAHNHRATGRKICSLVSKSAKKQKVAEFCEQYVALRAKLNRSASFEQEQQACDALLIALNPGMKKGIKRNITARYHNQLYADALRDLKNARIAEGFFCGTLFGAMIIELILLNYAVLWTGPSAYHDKSYPMNSVV